MRNNKATSRMYILPFVQSEDVAPENHKRIASSYAGFDLPRREGPEIRHDRYKSEVIETQVEGGQMV